MADFARMFAPGGVIDRFLLDQSRAAGQSFRQDLGLAAEPQPDAQAFRYDFAPVPAGRRNSRRLLPDRRQSADHQSRGQAADAERRGADRDAADQRRLGGRPAGNQRAFDGAMAGRGRGSRLDRACCRKCPTACPSWSAPAPGLCSVCSTPARCCSAATRSSASFVIGGREVSYQFTAASLNNPLSLPSLRQFKCPNGL